MTPRVFACVVAALVIGACGSGKTPGERALDQVQSGLEDVRSGTLAMTFLASTADARSGRGLGFSLRGPFAVAREKGQLPVADLDYTRITGTKRRTTTFISTGRAAFVELDGVAYRLDPAQVAGLRSDGDGGGGGLEGLELDDWIDNPTVRRETQDGAAVNRITGKVDAIKAFNGVLGLAQEYGASTEDAPKPLDGDAANRVRRMVRSSSVEVVAGQDDHLLRHFELVIALAPGAQQRLRGALGKFAGVRLRFALDVFRPNRPVRVAAPARARPASDIPSNS